MFRNSLSVIAVCMILALGGMVARAQDTKDAPKVEEVKTPTLADADKTKVQLLAAQVQLIQYKYAQVKAEFDKITNESTQQFQAASAKLTEATEAAYKSAGVDKTKFKLDQVTGEFAPVPAPKPADAK